MRRNPLISGRHGPYTKKQRITALLRREASAATGNYTISGREKTIRKPKPITLADPKAPRP